VQDRNGAHTLLSVLATQFRRLRVIWADGAYAGALPSWVRGLRKWGEVRLEIVRKAKGRLGFAVVPWRWIVERTFAWLGRYRRLKSDYERLPEATEATIHIAMIRLWSVGWLGDDAFHTRSKRLARRASIHEQPRINFIIFPLLNIRPCDIEPNKRTSAPRLSARSPAHLP
jgi:transposase